MGYGRSFPNQYTRPVIQGIFRRREAETDPWELVVVIQFPKDLKSVSFPTRWANQETLRLWQMNLDPALSYLKTIYQNAAQRLASAHQQVVNGQKSIMDYPELTPDRFLPAQVKKRLPYPNR